MKWITAGDIKSWVNGNARHCQQTLPELVRRLILATAGTIEKIDFPSGDSVTTGGWDGQLNTPAILPFFPVGISGWEMGTEKSAQTKAEGDYTTRTANPLGLVQADTTFVFVTPRPWPKRDEWSNSKRTFGIWKDVRVINADGLELWLDSCPAVAVWLARQIGKVVSNGIRDLENVWEEWSLGTEPPMTPEMVVGGRTKEVEKIQQWLAQRPSVIEVQGDHPSEALAFLYASVAALPETERAKALSRCLVVDDINELRQCVQAFQSPLIIAAPGACIEAATAAAAKGHHVFISMDAKVLGVRDVLRLSRPHRSVIEKILQEKGMPEIQARQLARDFGRSIPVLRRQLFRSNAVSAPAWTSGDSIRVLMPMLFAGSWDENKEGDRKIIESLAGEAYDKFIEKLTPLSAVDDAPVHKVGSVWMLKSPLDAWFLIARHLTNNDLKLYEEALLAILTKTNPKYELSPEQRWAAAIYGKANPYSEWLRSGLVESLVFLAVFGNRTPNIDSTQYFADNIVKKIFTSATSWEAWASIQDVTPLLSEASPETFMESIEQFLKDSPQVLKELMRDDGSMFGECRHSGLLWALESIAWSSEYLTRASLTLLKLAMEDPGGKWDNRPVNSLRDIFMPGLPQTHASPDVRLAALDKLIQTDVQAVWKFAEHYFSEGHMSEAYRFKWRETDGTRRGLDYEGNESYRQYQPGLVQRLNDLACMRPNIIDALQKFTQLPADLQERLLLEFERLDATSLSKDERAQLMDYARNALNWINSYGEEDIKKQSPGLRKILDKFAPEDVIERVGWVLSTPWPRLPEGEPREYDAKDVAIKEAQEKAAREVLDNATFNQIFEFAGKVSYPMVLGSALAKVAKDEGEDNRLLDFILQHTADDTLLARGYALGRVEVAGVNWIKLQIERLKTNGTYSSVFCALLYLGLPETKESWVEVPKEGQEVENLFWKYLSRYIRFAKGENASFAIEKLLGVNRPDVALQIAGNPQLSLPSMLIKQVLQDLLRMEDKKFQAGVMDEFHLGNIFKQLYERNDLPLEEMAALEWPFAALFDELQRYTVGPMAIHRLLQQSPSLFIQLIPFLYKRDDGKPDPDTEATEEKLKENRWRVAREVLHSWRLFPGLKEDGKLNEQELSDWVDTAIKQCAASNHTKGCEIELGFMLARSPSDPDGSWPHIAVRNLLERLANQSIERHIQTGIYNNRGVVSKSLFDGGRQEWEISKKYKEMGNKLKSSWPRTSAMLTDIAKTYEHEAKREDIDSDLHELQWD